MFDDLKIRSKLVLLVAGPIVIIVLLAAFGARDRQSTAASSREVESLAALAQSNSNVADALQRESLYSTAFVASDRESWKNQVKQSRAAADKAIADALGRQQGMLGTSAAFRSASTLAADAADKLTYIRTAVDQGYRWDQVTTTYRALQGTFLEVNNAIASTLEDPQVANDLRTGAALATYKAALAQEGALLVGAAEFGSFATDEVEEGQEDAYPAYELFLAATAEEENEFAILSSISDTERKGEIRNALTSDAYLFMADVRDQTTFENASGDVAPGSVAPRHDGTAVSPKQLDEASNTVLADLHEVEQNLYGEVIQRSQDTRSTAERAANFFLVGAVVAIVIAIIAAVYLGRRITGPLNHLTVAADRLSSEQMPRLVEWLRNPSDDDMAFEIGSLSPIEVETNDEIGRLASSFNEVQRVAGEVAAEQAALLRKGIGEMFVNLARRNQALLDRQIDFIDELERGEEDPDQLENLYRLDHLATRMRRNAESLLVLAGAEPPRRRGRPAPLANVVRAALAEVEDFGRIDLLSFDEILVASNVAADLAHLLSELMENATNFSPPETRVEVVGHRTKADGYVISVTDHGIGMSSEQILEANESLAKPPLVGLALSRSLGFIVVGRLAGRHGITVRMMSSPSGGVTAVVSIPPTLITDTPGMGSTGDRPLAEPTEAPARLKPVLGGSNGAPAQAPAAAAPAPASPAPVAEPAAFAGGTPPPLTFSPDESFGAPPAAATAEATSPTGPKARSGGPAPADPKTGLPNRRSQGGGENLPPRRRKGSAPAAEEPVEEAPAAAPVEEAPVEPVLDAGDLLTTDGGVPTSARLDGPPPAAPELPARPGPARTPRPASAEESKPFFLEDAQPPRLFGRAAETAPPAAPAAEAPAAPPAPPARRAPTAAEPSAPAEPVRMFSGGPSADDGGGAAKPLTARRKPAAEAESAEAAPVAPAPPAEPVTTASGLAKRTPRQAGGVRAIPGADVERGVGATRRSPDEVRNLLSRYRDGQQRARTEEPVPAGSTDEKEPNE